MCRCWQWWWERTHNALSPATVVPFVNEIILVLVEHNVTINTFTNTGSWHNHGWFWYRFGCSSSWYVWGGMYSTGHLGWGKMARWIRYVWWRSVMRGFQFDVWWLRRSLFAQIKGLFSCFSRWWFYVVVTRRRLFRSDETFGWTCVARRRLFRCEYRWRWDRHSGVMSLRAGQHESSMRSEIHNSSRGHVSQVGCVITSM